MKTDPRFLILPALFAVTGAMVLGGAVGRLRDRRVVELVALVLDPDGRVAQRAAELGPVPDGRGRAARIGNEPGDRVDRASQRLQGRVQFFNKYLGGTIAPRVQLDYIPAIACAAHVLVKTDVPAQGVEAHVRGGIALQRVWLTAASVGLHLQPEMTPLIFRWYARAGQTFSAVPAIAAGALALAGEFERIGGFGPDQGLTFFCRVGVSDAPRSRSLRKSVEELMLPGR